MLNRTFGCVRVVWNQTLAARHARWQADRTSTSYAQTDAALTLMKKDPGLAFLTEVSSVPLQQVLRHQHQAFTAFFARRARYPRFKSRRGRQCRPLHPPRLHPARRRAAAGQDGRPAAVHLVLAGRGRGRAGPHDGGRVPGAGRPLVRDLRHRHRRPRAAGGDRARRRRRPGRDGPRRHLGRGEDRQPAAPGAQGPEPGPLPAAPGPLPERLGEPGQGRGEGGPRPPQGPRRAAGLTCTAPAPAWSARRT